MATAKRFNENGEGQSELALPDDLFDAAVHEQALYEVVNAHLANRRQGTAKTKERGEVAYSTAKLYRQKGTGRARAGSLRSPVRSGGGTVFGPKPRNHRQRVNRKVRRLALRSALSDRARGGAVHVIDDPQLDAPKTKLMASLVENMGLGGKTILFVIEEDQGVLQRSLRNLEKVEVLPASQLNAYQVLRSENLVFTESSLARVTEVFGS
jgi:large subunit ribosomal protein L4